MKAPEYCTKAAELMDERAASRDQADTGERSMARCVYAFNAMTGHNLTEEDGWLFMVYLKHARMRGGSYNRDDYEDAVAYEALAAEAAEKAQDPCAGAPVFKVPNRFYTPPRVELYGAMVNEHCHPGTDCSKCPTPCR